MKIIKRDELDDLLNFEDIFNKTKRAYELFSKNETITPPFTVFTVPESNGSVHFKCGYVPGEEYFAMKYSGAFYNNEKLGISNFLGLFTVFNSKTGEVESVIDDKGYLTDYRTGIAGAIATSALARDDSKVVAMIGTGIQARMQLFSLLKVMSSIEQINVWGRSKDKVSIYVDGIKSLYPKLKIKICNTAKDAVFDADIIYTVTYSENPIIKSEWIKPGVHITAVGACEPNMQELESSIFNVSNIVCVDSLEACSKNGELNHGLKDGCIEKEQVLELGQYISEKRKRKKSDISICDLVGIGFQDAVIASCVMKEYLKKQKRKD